MPDPHRLIAELCLATGARISEINGLQIKHIDMQNGSIRIEQRHWRGDIDSPKTERSKRTLTLGNLIGRLKTWVDALEDNKPEAWVFPQNDRRKPMWDSGPRAELKEAARAEKCDFPGFGLHSLRRANITWRQEVGGSSIEASRIAGHASTKMTEEYTVVQLKRQEELTRRIQEKLTQAAGRINGSEASPEVTFPTADQNSLASDSPQSHECDRSIHQQRRSAMPKARKSGKVNIEKKAAPSPRKSKKAVILQLLKRPTGVSLEKLMAATGWQAHSVRGFLSAAVGKRMGLKVASSKADGGQRVYRIQS